MRRGWTLVLFLAVALPHPLPVHATSACETQKERFVSEIADAVFQGVEAIKKDDDRAYCAALKQALAKAQAYENWGRQSGCLSGDAATKARSLANLKAVVDRSRTAAEDGCK